MVDVIKNWSFPLYVVDSLLMLLRCCCCVAEEESLIMSFTFPQFFAWGKPSFLFGGKVGGKIPWRKPCILANLLADRYILFKGISNYSTIRF